MVDGCNPGVAFRKVILTLTASGVFTTAIIVWPSSHPPQDPIRMALRTPQTSSTALSALADHGWTKAQDPTVGRLRAG